MGYEREWMTVSPMSLYYWDSLAMEPWAPPRDVEPNQGAVLGVQVGPDLQILRGAPVICRISSVLSPILFKFSFRTLEIYIQEHSQ